MNRRFTLVWLRSEKFRFGKLLEYPEIMTQGETPGELEENTRDACRFMATEDVPEGYSRCVLHRNFA